MARESQCFTARINHTMNSLCTSTTETRAQPAAVPMEGISAIVDYDTKRSWKKVNVSVMALARFRASLRKTRSRRRARHLWRVTGAMLCAAHRFKKSKDVATPMKTGLKRCRKCFMQPLTRKSLSGAKSNHTDTTKVEYSIRVESVKKKESRKLDSDASVDAIVPASSHTKKSTFYTDSSTADLLAKNFYFMQDGEWDIILVENSILQDVRNLSISNLKESDFTYQQVLGVGGCGKVYLVQNAHSHRLFAMKVIQKMKIVETGRFDRAKEERDILVQSHDFPFITKLQFAFQSPENLFFVMEYCSGGNLHEIMIREFEFRNRCMQKKQYCMAMKAAAEGYGLIGALTYSGLLPQTVQNCHYLCGKDSIGFLLSQFGLHEEQVKFIVAEILLGLEFLHSLGVVYRDLKPQNVLLQVDGHVRLADFGISKFGDKCVDSSIAVKLRSNSYVGTPEYMSPEMIKGECQTSMIDAWGVGVLCHELLTGFPPFMPVYNEQTEETLMAMHFENILNPERTFRLPRFKISKEFCKSVRVNVAFEIEVIKSKSDRIVRRLVSDNAKSFLKKLLRQDPNLRMNISKAKQHQFLANIEFNSLASTSGFHRLSPRIHLHRCPSRNTFVGRTLQNAIPTSPPICDQVSTDRAPFTENKFKPALKFPVENKDSPKSKSKSDKSLIRSMGILIRSRVESSNAKPLMPSLNAIFKAEKNWSAGEWFGLTSELDRQECIMDQNHPIDEQKYTAFNNFDWNVECLAG